MLLVDFTRPLDRRLTQAAGTEQHVIDGHVCHRCGEHFSLSDYDFRHLPEDCGEYYHDECCPEDHSE